jgi:hypothetical protein
MGGADSTVAYHRRVKITGIGSMVGVQKLNATAMFKRQLI